MNLEKISIILIVICFVAAGFFTSCMKASRTTPEELKGITIGEEVKVVCEIKEVNGDTLTLEVLTGGKDYNQRSGFFLKAVGWKNAKIIMGKPENIEVGGIAHFAGTKTADDRISLLKIVNLTGYVKGPKTE
ncbi:MAG: hypothetical protein A3C43_03420 [Candidatus Schekmanbacteria bacterium RIFCSPHIGHO2_02_FULL_38_11]|uniref:DUF5666 domain-containing protein n=1 Tax=Candidatus Schekmanbacteria bacterium RIFCSPLOWO2_12_FULL_38_15 TaxID=1817883 RepID=A0A1F7SFK7_9BACT|nr:MAG: hypothetical protein A2043_05950 [Candidatus Schekmanbacteria bacterium GWA2_38_9]OGL48542.1 MAG: hypothetical protein A3H37_05525 [Candidatus Schekmanbacteria bacterium RIFCSPLOWO2_02_FULL_38_14]OGL52521.1 MAG: hypothetical protein A3G31_11080 [Candidatus Schekmanbacteria bacterium RIFCSPLOWO2_12_FULL_38_15]OGL53817.1 MAG: hypothetical protein A3C43_03420 [Candidatus Schekmanbacteria bacterium RIFCSPHIGHO2_02_FULL_38_11]